MIPEWGGQLDHMDSLHLYIPFLLTNHDSLCPLTWVLRGLVITLVQVWCP